MLSISMANQRRKNLGSRVALLPGKFLSVRKVFARLESFCAYNRKKTVKLFQYFQNYLEFSRWFLFFRTVSKLSGFIQITTNFPNYFKTIQSFSRWLSILRTLSKNFGFFQIVANFPDGFKTIRIYPDDCQFSGRFQDCTDFSRSFSIFRNVSKPSFFSGSFPIFLTVSKLCGVFQMITKFRYDFKTVGIFPDDFKTVGIFPDAKPVWPNDIKHCSSSLKWGSARGPLSHKKITRIVKAFSNKTCSKIPDQQNKALNH